MEDEKIVDLYWERDQSAIYETQQKYGRYCHYIAYHILTCDGDAEECVNDTWLNAWNAIPPKRPQRLRHFLGCITRNLALNRYDYNHAQKRRDGVGQIVEEFWECAAEDTVSFPEELALKEAINGFLASLEQRTRVIFLRRYWYLCTIKEISAALGLTESNVKVILHRTRNKFKAHLIKEGFYL